MDDKTIEQIIIKAVEIGVYNTLSQLGLTSEVITEAQARKKIWATINCRMALEKVDRWISNRKPQKKAKVYFKRTELETASRMLDIQNIIPSNKIFRE